MVRRRVTRVVVAAGLVVAALVVSGCRSGQVTYVVDGDTLDVDGITVRVQGIDTPERGQCGYSEAKNRVAQLVSGRKVLVANGGGDTVDRYGREIAYVLWEGQDLGTILIAEGLAKARYDDLDGYDRHNLQDRYRSLDAATPNRCG
jgi:endonuclease YncB( thermonuclease family)